MGSEDDMMRDFFMALGASSPESRLTLKELSSAQPPSTFLRSIPILFHHDVEKNGSIGLKDFTELVSKFMQKRDDLLIAFDENEGLSRNESTRSSASGHESRAEDDDRDDESVASHKYVNTARARMIRKAALKVIFSLSAEEGGDSGNHAVRLYGTQKWDYAGAGQPDVLETKPESQAQDKNSSYDSEDAETEHMERIADEAGNALKEQLVAWLRKSLAKDGGRMEFMDWLWKSINVDGKEMIGVEELQILMAALAEDRIELGALMFHETRTESPEAILKEYDVLRTGGLSRENFLVIADLITREYEQWQNRHLELFGKYKLGRTLGNGSHGIVRHATDIYSRQKYAMKMVAKGNCASLSKVDQEIEILRQLRSHDHVVKLEEVLEDEENIFIIMELCGGGSLIDLTRLYKSNRVPENIARTYMRQLFDVLIICNENGICHRDVRLENLLLDNEANLKLSDFGQSGKFSGGWDVFATTLVGSIYTLSPEQVSGSCYSGQKIDVWSAGVSLYCLLVGYPPFFDDDVEIMLASISSGSFELPSFLSAEAADILQQMINVNSEQRPTFKELIKHPWIRQGAEEAPEFTRFQIRLHEFYSKRPDIAEMIVANCLDEFHVHFHIGEVNASNGQSSTKWELKCYSLDNDLKFSIALIVQVPNIFEEITETSDDEATTGADQTEDEPAVPSEIENAEVDHTLDPRDRRESRGRIVGGVSQGSNSDERNVVDDRVKKQLSQFPRKRLMTLRGGSIKESVAALRSRSEGNVHNGYSSAESRASLLSDEATLVITIIAGESGIFLKVCRRLTGILQQKLEDTANAQLKRLQRRKKRAEARRSGATPAN